MIQDKVVTLLNVQGNIFIHASFMVLATAMSHDLLVG